MDKYTLTFTAQEMAVLNEALVRLPYGQVAPLIAAINQQIKTASTPGPDSSTNPA